MLVLTRKRNQKIKIGKDIYITVLQTAKGQVKIGIEAPKDINIVREEIKEKINGFNLRNVVNFI